MSIKKTNAKSFLAGGMLTLLAVGAITAGTTYAFNGPENSNNSNKGAGFESATYEIWKERVEENPRGNNDILDIVNADNFDQFKEMMILQKEGDQEGADAIRAELGLPTKAEMEVHREEVQLALETGDYEAWKEAVSGSPRGEQILEIIDSEEDFNKLTEAHQYRENGKENFDKAREIMDELGFEKPEKGQGARGNKGMGGGRGVPRGSFSQE